MIKKLHVSFDENTIQKNSTIHSVFPNTKRDDYENVMFDTVYGKYPNIIREICALANTNGGSIYIGINKANRIVGGYSKNRNDWLMSVEILTRIIYNTIHTVEYEHLQYQLKNYIVLANDIESFCTEFTIPKSKDLCVVNSNGNISSYMRRDSQSIDYHIPADIVVRMQPGIIHQKALQDVGDIFEGEENEFLEFKASFNFVRTNEGLGKYISSFANTNGGQIVVGVADDGKIQGIKIENSTDWDELRRSLILKHNEISNKDFLALIKTEKTPLKRKDHYLVHIIIPKNPFDKPIMVQDKEGTWNKYVRVLSCSLKDERMQIYSENEFNEMQRIAQDAQKKYEDAIVENHYLKNYGDKSNYDNYMKMFSIFGFFAMCAIAQKN